ncbi:MAG TPA: hypothetical protein VIP46_05425 [Pyrinomonadaceae bacterium]
MRMEENMGERGRKGAGVMWSCFLVCLLVGRAEWQKTFFPNNCAGDV